ncbi:hypothetical protein D8O04_29090 [Burkholderia mallei]|nr:hypothetical protein D8O04_29090 [Burkholderia mallei]
MALSKGAGQRGSSSTTRILEGFFVSMSGILSRLGKTARLRLSTGYSQLQNLPALLCGVKTVTTDSFTRRRHSVDTPST